MKTEELNRMLDEDRFECELCGLSTPEAGGHNTDAGRLCFSCMMWFEKFGDDDFYFVDLPEDWDV